MPPTFFISAGEASGEHYGALLVAALKERIAEYGETANFYGMGGQRMAAEGLKCVVRAEDMAVMGLTEVVAHLPRIYRELEKLKRAIKKRPPSVAILIDFPEIHIRLAKEFHRLGVPVIFFVSPQLWAWKKYRIKLVQQFVDRMLVIFPFEESFYREHGVEAEFVGHPLADQPAQSISRQQFADENDLDPEKTWIGLLPGSRPMEIRDHLPTMLRAAQALSHSMEYILPFAPTLNERQRNAVRRIVEKRGEGLTIRFVDDSRAALFHARASIVASGTATVEAALVGNPFVVVYRVSPITYAIAKQMVKVPHVAMVNLIADKRVVPELIQSDFKAENIVEEIERLLPYVPPRQSMMQELVRIRVLLAKPSQIGAIDRVAEIALDMVYQDSVE